MAHGDEQSSGLEMSFLILGWFPPRKTSSLDQSLETHYLRAQQTPSCTISLYHYLCFQHSEFLSPIYFRVQSKVSNTETAFPLCIATSSTTPIAE